MGVVTISAIACGEDSWMNPATDMTTTVVAAAIVVVTASSVLWLAPRGTLLVLLKIIWLYFVTGIQG
jgi:hypothetical protein